MDSCWAMFRDIALGIAALWTAWVAQRGLNAWQDKLHGKVDFELARSILTCLARIRTYVGRTRSGNYEPNEFPTMKSLLQEGESEKDLSSKEKNRRENLYVMSNRVRPLNEERDKLWSLSEEAEALWGSEIREPFGQLNVHLNSLIFSIRRRFSEEPGYADGKERMANHNIVFGDTSEKDEYWVELNRRIEAIGTFVRPHLKREA